MGTTSEKLTYLNETKQLLKDKINNLGGSIDDNTTFREYANQLQNVYDNFPKTEYQEGTEVNLGVTIKGKLDYENGVVGIGNIEQDSTQGYNLINASLLPVSSNGFTITRDNNGNIIINGTPNYSSGYKNIVLGTATTLQAGTYTASVQNKIDGIGLDVGGFGGSLNLVMSGTTSSKTSSSSQAEECILSINVRSDVGTLTNFVLNPMVVSGATVKDYEKYTGGQASPNPSYPQQIKSVTGNQDVVVSGKNLFEPVISVDGTQIVGSNMSNLGVTDGEFSFTANGTDVYFGQVLASGSTYMANRGIKIYRNGNEKISYKISNPEINRNFITAYDNNGTSLGYVEKSGSAQGTYTFPTNCDFVTFRIGKGDAVSGTTYKFKVIVAYGDEIPDYEPYKTPKTYQLSLGDHKFYGIGNYKDELVYDVDEDKVYKNSYIKEIGKDDVLQRLSSGYMEFTDVVRSVINLGDLPSSISSANGLCSHLVFLADFTRNIEHFYVQGTQIFFFIKKSRLSEISITGIYNYLATLTDLKFCYVMNTPTLTEITDTTLKAQVKAWYYGQSLDGTTIIEGNGDLPMIIKCRALKGE